MATPEITLRGEVRGAVIDCVVRDVESSLDAVQADHATAMQTFDCLDLLNARAQARSLADALELLARLVDPHRVDEELERERQFAELQQGEATDDGIEAGAGIEASAEVDGVEVDDEDQAERRPSNWDEVDRTAAKNWVGEAAGVPEFLQTPRGNGRLTA